MPKIWYDEFRLRIIQSCFMSKAKMWAVSRLKWMLGKLDTFELKKCIINKTVIIEVSKFVPDDDGWHRFDCTLDFFFKVNKDGSKEEKGIEKMYIDGEERYSQGAKFDGKD